MKSEGTAIYRAATHTQDCSDKKKIYISITGSRTCKVTLWDGEKTRAQSSPNRRETPRVKGVRNRADFQFNGYRVKQEERRPCGPHLRINDFADREAAESGGYGLTLIHPHEKADGGARGGGEGFLITHQPHQNPPPPVHLDPQRRILRPTRDCFLTLVFHPD